VRSSFCAGAEPVPKPFFLSLPSVAQERDPASPGNMDREDAREVLFTLQQLVVAINHEPGTGNAETGVFRQDLLTGRTKIYFTEYYFGKWDLPGREKLYVFTPENRAPRLYGQGPNIICENSAQFWVFF
jgi:hypothetical protein